MKTQQTDGSAAGCRAVLLTAFVVLGGSLQSGTLGAAEGGLPTNNPVAHLKLPWTDEIKWANVRGRHAGSGQGHPGEDRQRPGPARGPGRRRGLFPAGQSIRFATPSGSGTAWCCAGRTPRRAARLTMNDTRRRAGSNSRSSSSPTKATARRSTPRSRASTWQRPGHGVELRRGEPRPQPRPRFLRGGRGPHLRPQPAGVRLPAAQRGAWPIRRCPTWRSARSPGSATPSTWSRAAIHVFTAENGLVANNRLPRSGDDNFTMNGYLHARPRAEAGRRWTAWCSTTTIARASTSTTTASAAPAARGRTARPKRIPTASARGWSSATTTSSTRAAARSASAATASQCRNNVIRFAKDVWRPTVTGRHLSHGASTNDNRAVEMRGWRWVVDGNDYEVYRNVCASTAFTPSTTARA